MTQIFYSDAEVQLHSSIDRLLNSCDDTDMVLLQGLANNETYKTISEKVYMTTDSLKYRKKRLMHIASCATTDEFRRFIAFCDALHVL